MQSDGDAWYHGSMVDSDREKLHRSVWRSRKNYGDAVVMWIAGGMVTYYENGDMNKISKKTIDLFLRLYEPFKWGN